MIFETITDENGKTTIKQLSYNSERQEYTHDTIKPSIFPDLSQSQKRELEIINHFFKENMFLSLSDFDKKTPHITNAEFDTIDFKSLFKDVFSTVFDLFKENFFINEKGEIINTHDGFSLKIDKETQEIHLEKLPGYEIFWEKEEKSLKCRRQKNESFDIREHIPVRPYDYISIEFKRQFLLHTGSLFKTDKYPVDVHVITEKMFNHLNKDGYIKCVDNFEDFKKEFEVVHREYYDNEILFIGDNLPKSSEDKFLELNEGSLFDFFDNRMSSLFYKNDNNIFSLIAHDNESMSVYRKLIKKLPGKNIFIEPEKIDEIHRILNIYMHIKYRIFKERKLYNASSDYLFDVDRGFRDENKNHQVHNLSYSDFLEYYHMADNTMNLCFYYYMYEFSLVDEQMHDYINDVVLNFTKNNEKAHIILSESGISILDFNKKIKLPLPVVRQFANKESKDFYSVAVELYSETPEKIGELKGTSDDIKIVFNYATANNKNKELFKKLDESDYFTSSKNIIDFINVIYDEFDKCKEDLFEKIDLSSYINNEIKEQEEKDDEDPMVWINRIRAERKNPPKMRNLNNSELIDIVAEKIISLSTGEYASDQKEIIENLLWIDKKLSVDNTKIGCFKRDIPLYDDCEIYRIEDRSEKIQVMSLLDYHLLKGHNEVVYYLKEKGLVPKKIEDCVTSIEYALLGACSNDIIDWVCKCLDIKSNHKVSIFSFVRLPIPVGFGVQQVLDSAVLQSSKYKCLFNYDPKCKDDMKVLEKMMYLYNKYDVNLSKNCERIYYLLNSENEKIIKEHLGIDKAIVDKIKYSLFIKKLIFKNNISVLADELKTGRLTVDMNLMPQFMFNKEVSEVSGVLNLLYMYMNHKCGEEDVKFIEKLINLVFEYMDTITFSKIKDFKCSEGLNIFEIVISRSPHEFRKLIKKMVVDYDFNLKSGIYCKDESSQEMVYKDYRDIYFGSHVYTRNLYDFLVSQSEKEKITKKININNSENIKKRRM